MKIQKKYVEINTIKKHFSIKEFLSKKDKVLIVREYGGIGDIINTRPLFKTLKLTYSDLQIDYAVPSEFFGLLEDHVYIDNLIDVKNVNYDEYGEVINISYDCGKYEMENRRNVSMHRSDIWAEISAGIKLIDHDYCIKLDQNILNELRNKYKFENKVAFFPKSSGISKDLSENQIKEVISKFKENNVDICIIDDRLNDFDCEIIKGHSLKELIHLISLFDYVISVDTGPFHIASALSIPTVGIFSWTNGRVLSKYHSKVEILQKESDVCPCWDWPACPYCKDNHFPLPCINEMNSNHIYDAFFKLNNK